MKECAAALAVTAALLCASIALGQKEKPPAYKHHKDALVYAELAQAPQKARTKHNPLEKDPEAVAAGRNLFEQHCTECHGDLAEGGRKGPSLMVEQVQTAEPGAIFWILTNGVVWRGMPVWSKLPEPQRWQLVTYIKSLGVAEVAPAAAPSPKSDSAMDSPSPHR
ncbi:MAG TPA: c-type cytochrome [Candidatus Binatus sp.]|jgi:mono/diheme cytochrome c family protein|nr:c-type cytochrome [Candidatus Binatus sp.]